MKLINESVLEFTKGDDLRTIELDYDYQIDSEEQLASILNELDYDYGEMTTSENVKVVYKKSSEIFRTNGFDLICALKSYK